MQLKKIKGYRVRLDPVAHVTNGLPQNDDDWKVEESDAVLTLVNMRTRHMLELGRDQIRGFTSDPMRDSGGVKYGLLKLTVQVTLTPDGAQVRLM